MVAEATGLGGEERVVVVEARVMSSMMGWNISDSISKISIWRVLLPFYRVAMAIYFPSCDAAIVKAWSPGGVMRRVASSPPAFSSSSDR